MPSGGTGFGSANFEIKSALWRAFSSVTAVWRATISLSPLCRPLFRFWLIFREQLLRQFQEVESARCRRVELDDRLAGGGRLGEPHVLVNRRLDHQTAEEVGDLVLHVAVEVLAAVEEVDQAADDDVFFLVGVTDARDLAHEVCEAVEGVEAAV